MYNILFVYYNVQYNIIWYNGHLAVRGTYTRVPERYYSCCSRWWMREREWERERHTYTDRWSERPTKYITYTPSGLWRVGRGEGRGRRGGLRSARAGVNEQSARWPRPPCAPRSLHCEFLSGFFFFTSSFSSLRFTTKHRRLYNIIISYTL